MTYFLETDQVWLEKQSELYYSVLPKLLEEYEGKFIRFEDGDVLDVGDSIVELAKRAYEKEGMRVLYLTQVLKDDDTMVPTMWTPFDDYSITLTKDDLSNKV